MGDGRFVACCAIKIQNKLKYNFSGRVSLLQVATVTRISTNWLKVQIMEGNFSGNFSHGSLEASRIGSSLQEFLIIEGSRNRG